MHELSMDDDLLPGSPARLQATYEDLALALRRIKELETELERLRAPVRPSLEVLQRMANGLDPFDKGRFQCAVAALPHETPKLSASISQIGFTGGIADRMEAAARRRRDPSELRVIEGGPPAA